MLTWLRNLRSSRPAPATRPARTTLACESLEAREVPAVLGAAGAYNVFGIGNTDVVLTNRSVDEGNMAIARGGQVDVLGRATVTGTVSLDNRTGLYDPKAPSVGSVQRPVDLSGAAQAALNASVSLDMMTATQTVKNITASKVLVGNGGTNVVDVRSIDLNGNDKLTLSGSANDYFYINVANGFSMSGRSAIVLAGGVQASHVIFNVLGRGDAVAITGNAVAQGTILATQRDVALGGDLYGSIVGARNHAIVIGSDAHVHGVLFQEPVAAPPAGTAVISGVVKFSLFGGDEVGPVTDATVSLIDANGNTVTSAGTDGNGNYTLSGVPAGTYTLSVLSNTYGGPMEITVTIADGSMTVQNVTFNQ